ncbi:hypothetical protein ACFQE1_11805 [Halobium palmae]|uniref:Uncharacterized protein n=1 Tax=Halobium palmae TaxID=1776492 RepID=A0ABD5S1B9_9EURY
MSKSGSHGRTTAADAESSSAESSTLRDDEWTVVREFVEGEEGYTQSRYEAKFVEDVSKRFVEDDVVLVKETSGIDGRDRMYHFPEDVFRRVVDGLP